MMICASITESDMDSMVRVANLVSSDIVEIRLDYIRDFSCIERLREIKKPLIATCMPKFEGGNFEGSEEERIALLLRAIEFSDYVTIELRTEKNLISKILKSAKRNGVKVILAYHDFESTPDKEEIIKILRRQKALGGDIGKIAFMPKNYQDVMNTMEVLFQRIGIPIIAISMGRIGRISRVIGPILGSYLTFASPEKGKESAEGQLTVEELRKIMEILEG